MINRYIELNELFFEGLGIWVGEGSKSKGLYVGNTNLRVILHFLKFVEEILGLNRKIFKVCISVSKLENEVEMTTKISEVLKIPLENFKRISVKKKEPKINKTYVQVYFDSTVLVELMKSFFENLKETILNDIQFIISFLRGIFTGESGVVLNKRGRVHHVNFSNKNLELVEYVTQLLGKLGIKRGKYFKSSMKFPIYGRENFKKLIEIDVFKFSLRKKKLLEEGFKKYLRKVEPGEVVERKILEQLLFKPMTYSELSKNLNKGKSTIQYTYIPKLIEKGLVEYLGKKGRKLLFGITEKGKEFLLNLD